MDGFDLTLIGTPDPTTLEGLIVVNPSLLSDTPYPWTNYEAIGTGRISNALGGKDLSIVMRYVDQNNFYWMGLGLWNHKWGIARKLNGVTELLVSDGVDGSDAEVVVGQTYVVKAVANGNTLELWVNGAQVLTFTDSNFAGGSVGFRNFNTAVEWDNLNVNPLGIVTPYTLAISSTAGGTTNPTGNPTYNAGAFASVAAIADVGHHLADWVLDGAPVGGTPANPFTITMNDNHTLQAVFEQDTTPYVLTVNGSIYGTTNPPAGTYQKTQGETVTVYAYPIPNNRFDHWLLDGNRFTGDTNNPVTIVMETSHALTPVFASEGFNILPLLIASGAAVGLYILVR